MGSETLLLQEIERKQQELRQLKTSISNIKARNQALSSQPTVTQAGELQQNLAKILPAHLRPRNVGNLYHVQWPFYFSMDFDLSQTQPWIDNAPDGAITSDTRQTRTYQVTQESAFLFTAISRNCNDYDVSGDLGPLQVEIRDRQSSRFFSNAKIPIQMFGAEGWPTPMPTPFLVMPNAVIEMEISSFLEPGVVAEPEPDQTGRIQFTFFGYRMRIEDAQKILSSIYG
jgi:hypothetical protein